MKARVKPKSRSSRKRAGTLGPGSRPRIIISRVVAPAIAVPRIVVPPRAKPVTPGPKVIVPRTVVPAKPERGTRTSTKTTKKSAAKKSKAKKKAIAQRIRRQKARVEAEADKLRKLEAKARGKGKRSPQKKRVRKQRKKLEEQRKKDALLTADKPRKTPAERRESQAEEQKRRRRRFRELLNHALETGQTPRGQDDKRRPRKRTPRRIDSRDNIGEQRLVRVRRIVTLDAVEEIVYRVDRVATQMSRRYRIWSGRLDMSGFGEKLFGSNATVLDKPGDPDATFFVAATWDSTGAWATYPGFLDALRSVLESYADMPATVVYLHSILIMNYDRKRER